ncbi:MAG: hypothetical protein J1E42_09100 [Akkermansiaceae bacterium]|nr:hypothetical protein [Akkermansiaceae bacterium]
MVRLIKTWGLMIAFAVGALCPGLHIFVGALPYLVGAMLTITLVGMEVRELRPQVRHGLILVANVVLGLLPWAALKSLGYEEYAEAAFFAGLVGEAASAPVIVSMLGGKSEFAAVGLALNSAFASLMIPLVVPFIITPYGGGEISRLELFAAVLEHVTAMLLVPCLIAVMVRKLRPSSKLWARKLSLVSLAFWLFCMAMVSAKGVTRVSEAAASWAEIAPYAGVVLGMCVLSFWLGRKIGGRDYALECGQCLGQKNATVGIYLALCYAAPLVFLGPTLYLLFQHIFNTWQMVRYNRRSSAA